MLNVRDLEERWLKYKIKSYSPYLFGGIILLVLLTVFALYTTKEPIKINTKPSVVKKDTIEETLHVKTQQKTVTTSPKVSVSKKLPIEKETSITSKNLHVNTSATPVEETPQRLQPSFSFLNAIEREPIHNIAKVPQIKKTKKINTQIKPAAEKRPPVETVPVAAVVVEAKPEPKLPTGIKIDHTKTHKEVQDIIHRFETNKNPALGLYLARYYYKMQNYEKAYNYALSTNHIDSNIEECWLIFASSQVKLGKKDDAVKTLIAYIKNSDSLNAKNLLHNIRTGAFQ